MTQAEVPTSIRVNGRDEAVDTGRRGIAVALNGAIVPRAAWSRTALHPGDSIEIVRVLQGG